MNRQNAIAIAITFCAYASSVEAGSVTFQQDVSGYSGTQDTLLRENLADTSHGNNVTLKVDGNSSPTAAADQSLILFDSIFGNGPNQIPLGAPITSATLTLKVTNSGTGGEFHRMLMPWGEDDTWNDWTNGLDQFGTELTTSPDVIAGPASGTFVIDVTSSVQAWSSGSSNYGWAILSKDNSTDGWIYHSSETADLSDRPLLSVVYTPTPAAAGLGLPLLGLLGITRPRRQRAA